MSNAFNPTTYNSSAYTGNLSGLDISKWNTTNVKTMSGMFQGTNFNGTITTTASQPIYINYTFSLISTSIETYDYWNVNKVTDFSNMFNGNTVFNQDISSWDITTQIGVNMSGIKILEI